MKYIDFYKKNDSMIGFLLWFHVFSHGLVKEDKLMCILQSGTNCQKELRQ